MGGLLRGPVGLLRAPVGPLCAPIGLLPTLAHRSPRWPGPPGGARGKAPPHDRPGLRPARDLAESRFLERLEKTSAAPVHAKAAAARAVRFEEPLEVAPAPRGQRFDPELGPRLRIAAAPYRPHERTLTGTIHRRLVIDTVGACVGRMRASASAHEARQAQGQPPLRSSHCAIDRRGTKLESRIAPLPIPSHERRTSRTRLEGSKPMRSECWPSRPPYSPRAAHARGITSTHPRSLRRHGARP